MPNTKLREIPSSSSRFAQALRNVSVRTAQGLRISGLFLTNCRPKADGLQPFHRMRHLRDLEIAAFYADTEFLALRQALPHLECEWFGQIDEYGSIRASIKARTGG